MHNVNTLDAQCACVRGTCVQMAVLLDGCARNVHATDMVIEAPVTVPGPRLRAQREGYGITRKDLAARLGHHRNTLAAWESAPAVDVRRQRLYLAALRELVDR